MSVIALAGLALVVSAAPAAACSCAFGKPKEKLAAADAAFIGKVVRKKRVSSPWGVPGETGVPGKTYRYRIRVRRSFKRRLGRRIRITSHTGDGGCGFEWRLGARVAAYLYGKKGGWSTSLCSLERPRALRRAASKTGAPRAARPVCERRWSL